jgi:hypothetical protein
VGSAGLEPATSCFIATIPNWIQAFAAVALVVLSGATLIVLRRYARDTKTISDKSVQQAAEIQRQADAAMQRLGLLKAQTERENAQELVRALLTMRRKKTKNE